MIQLSLLAYFKRRVYRWYGASVPMINPSGLLRQIYLTSKKICEVLMQTEKPVSARGTTDRMEKFLA